MKYRLLGASALMVLVEAVSAGVADQASAFPTDRVDRPSGTAVVQILCKYGSKNCVNPNPGFKPPKVGGAKLPGSGWQDPDCKYYGNCNTGGPGQWGDPSIARRRPSSHPVITHPVRTGHLK